MKDEMDALVGMTARVSDADVGALPLRPAEADLMEEIMSTPVLESAPVAEPPRRRITGRRLAALAGAAALVTAALFATQLSGQDDPAWAAEVLEVAEASPRLLLDNPDWRVSYVDEFSVEIGETTLTDGTSELGLRWSDASVYESLVEDRRHSADMETPVTVMGHEAVLMRYAGSTEFTTMWRHRGVVVEARGTGFPDQGAYEAALGELREVGVDAWLTAMPEGVVNPAGRDVVVAEMLDGIPTPEGFDPAPIAESATVNNRYHLGARVTGAVTCGWIEQWVDATGAGDEAAADEAVSALGTARSWAILHEMNDDGGWSETVWEYADAIVDDGVLPHEDDVKVDDDGETESSNGWQAALGCE